MANSIEAAIANSYPLICSMARQILNRERVAVSTGTLVHEVFLALRHRDDLEFPSEKALCKYIRCAMRSILVSFARERGAQKRSAELLRLTLGHEVADGGCTPEQLLSLDEALQRLQRLDPRLAEIAEMCAFQGMTYVEIAETLALDVKKVERSYKLARAFMSEAL